MSENSATAEVIQQAQRLLDLLLRNVLAGGVAVLAYGGLVGTFSFASLDGKQDDVSAWLLALYVAVTGPLLYSVHRVVLHPALLTLLLLFFKLCYWLKAGPLEIFKALKTHQTELRATKGHWGSRFDTWASQVHFVYCGAWALLAAALLLPLLAAQPPLMADAEPAAIADSAAAATAAASAVTTEARRVVAFTVAGLLVAAAFLADSLRTWRYLKAGVDVLKRPDAIRWPGWAASALSWIDRTAHAGKIDDGSATAEKTPLPGRSSDVDPSAPR